MKTWGAPSADPDELGPRIPTRAVVRPLFDNCSTRYHPPAAEGGTSRPPSGPPSAPGLRVSVPIPTVAVGVVGRCRRLNGP